MPRYFAYGSNMNPARMAGRELQVIRAVAGYLDGFELCFNKRSRYGKNEARANIGYARHGRVEGVLYELADNSEIAKLDPHEGTPHYYSRERYLINTEQGALPAWVYVANPAVVAEGILPPRWYLKHLLAGEEYLTPQYMTMLRAVTCIAEPETVDVG